MATLNYQRVIGKIPTWPCWIQKSIREPSKTAWFSERDFQLILIQNESATISLSILVSASK
jgi:hypothetical protein